MALVSPTAGCGCGTPAPLRRPLGLTPCFFPWHLLLSITADLEN